MNLDILHSPWRGKYVARDKSQDECVFCLAPMENNQNNNTNNLVAHKGEHSYVVMNLYPYNNGHVMVVPYIHENTFHNLNNNTIAEMNRLAMDITKGLTTKMNAHGFNIGFNIGNAGGAGIADHIHMHIVPRWQGDTNFMPVLGNTRVISQSMDESFKIIQSIFNNT